MAGRRIPPPIFKDGDDFYEWKRELTIWTVVTDIPEDKQAAAIYLSLEGKARECCKSIDVQELTGKSGKDTLLTKLQALYAVDQEQRIYQAYENFENYIRPPNVSIPDYLNEWERTYDKIVTKGITLPEPVLAYRILKSANLPSEKQSLVRATVDKLTLENMKKQIRAISDTSAIDEISEKTKAIKVEQDSLYTKQQDEVEDVYYNNNRGARGRRFFGGSRGGFKNVARRGSSYYDRNMNNSQTKTNPVNSQGVITRCTICYSKYHWMKDCPHNDRNLKCKNCSSVLHKTQNCPHQEYTFLTKDIDIGAMNSFVNEAFNQAVLDSGCSKTVCGKEWYNNFVQTHPFMNHNEIQENKESSSVFRFGDGKAVKSNMSVTLPVRIGQKKVKLETEVVDADIPLLLSKEAMKKSDTTIDFANDTVTMFGENIKLSLASSGHYMINLFPEKEVLIATTDEIGSNENEKELKKMATKLHLQFGHAPAHRIIELLKDAGKQDDKLSKQIQSVVQDCDTCKIYQKAKNRPVVSFNLAKDFNEVISMDLKFIESHGILHIIDNATKFSSAAVLKGKKKEEIVEKIFLHWIQVFGSPENFFSDNGGEFNNELMRELGELLNTRVLTTAAESPWSNGITERHNALLADMVEKVMEDTKCSLEVAVAWSVAAKNALKNVHGFSPNQLVFGRNPNIPTVFNSNPPALEGTTSSELIAEHLNAMHASRRAFIKAEASEKLRRALLKKTRMSTSYEYKTGDQVYYKRRNSRRWHGPGVVIGGINKQIFVKHGGTFLRVNPCHLQHVKTKHNLQKEKNEEKKAKSEINMNKMEKEFFDVDEQSRNGNTDDEEEEDEEETVISEGETVQSNSEEEYHDEDFTVNQRTNHQNSQIVEDEAEYENADTEENDNQQRRQERIGKEPRCLKNLRPYNKPGNKEDTLIASTAPNITDKSIPRKDSRIKVKMMDQSEITGNVITEKIDNVLYIQTDENINKPINTEDIKEWVFVNQEIPVKFHNTPEVIEAKHQELQNLKTHNIYEEVLKDKQNVIGTRWVITEKFDNGKKKTKARLVAKGFQENNDLKRDSPTCLKENLRLAAAIAVSNGWKIKSLDIKSAFLQGKSIQREVFIEPPIEANSDRVWKLKKVIYGLSDASRMWYLKVKETLEKLQLKMSKFDEAFFYRIKDGVLIGLIAIHVDDFLYVGNLEFEQTVINRLKEEFKISKSYDQMFNYLGIEMIQMEKEINFTQSNYIKTITPIVGDTNETVIKSKIGQLAWVANQTRPDICFDVCQASVNTANENNSTVKLINKCIKKLNNEQHSIKFVPLNLKKASLVSFADASFANLQNGASQGGFVIFLESENRVIPLAWQSRKIRRVVKSTLSAETMALMEGAEHCFLLKTMLKEILNTDVPISVKTDSKSLYDALLTSNTLEDKRLKVDICVVRDYIKKEEIKEVCWIPTEQQLADCLTKSGANPAKLLKVLDSAHL